MYWTCETGVMCGEMDGSAAVEVVSGLERPFGITIDYDASRMFWTEFVGDKIRSSKLDGTDIRNIVTLPPGSRPWGIAVYHDQIYWGNSDAKSLQTSSKSGQYVRTVFTESSKIQQLTTNSRNFPTTRRNHCMGRHCANICVLKSSRWWSTSSPYRCINWESWISSFLCVRSNGKKTPRKTRNYMQ